MKWPAWVAKINTKKTIGLIVAILLISCGLAWYFNHKASMPAGTNNSIAQDQIRLFKNDRTIDGRRELASAYEQNGQYNDSQAEWQKIATKTNQTSDWWALLNICASYHRSGSRECINKSASVLKGRIATLDFQTAYAIGELLETGGSGKLAAPFYNRALSAYNPPSDKSVSYPSITQLQAKINELSK